MNTLKAISEIYDKNNNVVGFGLIDSYGTNSKLNKEAAIAAIKRGYQIENLYLTKDGDIIFNSPHQPINKETNMIPYFENDGTKTFAKIVALDNYGLYIKTEKGVYVFIPSK